MIVITDEVTHSKQAKYLQEMKYNFFKLKDRKDFTESLASIRCETADRRNATTLTVYFCSLAMMGI